MCPVRSVTYVSGRSLPFRDFQTYPSFIEPERPVSEITFFITLGSSW